MKPPIYFIWSELVEQADKLQDLISKAQGRERAKLQSARISVLRAVDQLEKLIDWDKIAGD
jgi:hypothetical protein